MIDLNQPYSLLQLSESESFIARNDREIITPVIWNGLVEPLFKAFNDNAGTLTAFINDTKSSLVDLQTQITDLVLGEFPDDGIPGGAITDGTITTSKINNNAITTEKLNDACVTPEKLSGADDILDYVFNNKLEVTSGTVSIDPDYEHIAVNDPNQVTLRIPFAKRHRAYIITGTYVRYTRATDWLAGRTTNTYYSSFGIRILLNHMDNISGPIAYSDLAYTNPHINDTNTPFLNMTFTRDEGFKYDYSATFLAHPAGISLEQINNQYYLNISGYFTCSTFVKRDDPYYNDRLPNLDIKYDAIAI